MPLGVLFVMKTLEDERYVVIKAYKLTVFEILSNFFVLSYIACLCYPYIRVYQLCDIAPCNVYIPPHMILHGLFAIIIMACCQI